MSATKKIKIFLVADDINFLKALIKLLSKVGNKFMEIKVFPTGEKFLQNFQYKPAILVMDYNLNQYSPNLIHAKEVVKIIKSLHPETEVIMLSSPKY